MNSRQRVRLALEHKEADMLPIDFGAMRSTGISAIAYNKLKEHLGVNKYPTKVYDIFQQLAEPDEEVSSIMGADVVQLHRYAPAFGINIADWREGELQDSSKCLYPKDFNPVVNAKGNMEIFSGDTLIAVMPQGGLYYDVVHHPFENAMSVEDVNKIELYKMTDVELQFIKNNAKNLYQNTNKAILGCFGGNIFEAGQIDWGYQTFFINLMIEKEMMHRYFERITEQYLIDLDKYLKEVGQYIDVIQFGDDLGTQNDLQVSIDMYREMIKPYHKRIFQFVREKYPNIKVFLHSCGAIYDLIPDLIDAGVEILNPIQLSAKNMNPVSLKKEFGKDLVFWGGGVDTQTSLTLNSLSQIEDEVKRNIEIFAPGGGYIFTQVHNIQANISPERVMAVYNTAKKFRKYPISID